MHIIQKYLGKWYKQSIQDIYQENLNIKHQAPGREKLGIFQGTLTTVVVSNYAR
jgi:hypothetical protein